MRRGRSFTRLQVDNIFNSLDEWASHKSVTTLEKKGLAQELEKRHKYDIADEAYVAMRQKSVDCARDLERPKGMEDLFGKQQGSFESDVSKIQAKIGVGDAEMARDDEDFQSLNNLANIWKDEVESSRELKKKLDGELREAGVGIVKESVKSSDPMGRERQLSKDHSASAISLTENLAKDEAKELATEALTREMQDLETGKWVFTYKTEKESEAQNTWLANVLREEKDPQLTARFFEDRRKLAREMTAIDQKRLSLKMNAYAKIPADSASECARANLANGEDEIDLWMEKSEMNSEAWLLPTIFQYRVKLAAMRLEEPCLNEERQYASMKKRHEIENDLRQFEVQLAAIRAKKADVESKTVQEKREMETGVGSQTVLAMKPSITAEIWDAKLSQTMDIPGKDHWKLMRESEQETGIGTMWKDMERVQDERRPKPTALTTSSFSSTLQEFREPDFERYDFQNFIDEQTLSWASNLRKQEDRNGEPSQNPSKSTSSQPQYSIPQDTTPSVIESNPKSSTKRGVIWITGKIYNMEHKSPQNPSTKKEAVTTPQDPTTPLQPRKEDRGKQKEIPHLIPTSNILHNPASDQTPDPTPTQIKPVISLTLQLRAMKTSSRQQKEQEAKNQAEKEEQENDLQRKQAETLEKRKRVDEELIKKAQGMTPEAASFKCSPWSFSAFEF